MLTVLTSLACVFTLCRVSAIDTNAALTPWNLMYLQPEQVHIAIGENVSAIVVTWSTKNFTESVVEYGINGLTLRATGSSKKFVDSGDRKFFQYIHKVTLTNLQPKSRYMYHCGSNLSWSDIFMFNTVPDSTAWSPRLAVYGDLGTENAQSLPRLQQEVAEGRYDMFLHVGDFAYDMCSYNGETGDQFMRQIEPIAAYVPYMVAAGNHEAACYFSQYMEKFSMPRTKDNMYYSFDLGSAHFIGFSTEKYHPQNHIYKPVVDQYQWLENDLKEATKPENRAKHPWIITFGHRPMYCSDNDDGDDCHNAASKVRSGVTIKGSVKRFGLEDLFYKYGVDLEIWAHEHSYERLWPVYNHKVYNGSWDQPYTNPRAPVHITTGSAPNGNKIFLTKESQLSLHHPRASDMTSDHKKQTGRRTCRPGSVVFITGLSSDGARESSRCFEPQADKGVVVFLQTDVTRSDTTDINGNQTEIRGKLWGSTNTTQTKLQGCKEEKDKFAPNGRNWSAFRSSDYGYTRMQIHNATHLYLEQVSDDQNGAVIDRVWLIKEKHGPYELDIDL